jgi:LPS-assembly protein
MIPFLPRKTPSASARIASLSIATLALMLSPPSVAATPAPGADRSDKNIVLTADTVTRDAINNSVSAKGHVEFVQGPSMLLADHVTWNQSTDIVIATGDVKLVNDQGDIYFGEYLEITDDMRTGFIRNVSALLADNTRMVGRHAEKKGAVTTFSRAIYSPCKLCADDPSQAPTWEIDARKILHDTDAKRIYYHDATFEIAGIPFLWTPWYSTYDPSVKRADGILETMPGYRSQLGMFVRSTYYVDIAPDMDAILEVANYSLQGPLVGGQFRERFAAGQIQFSGSVTENDIYQYVTPSNNDRKTIRGHIFGNGEFDLSDNWRAGFKIARSLDNIYVLKYGITSAQVLPSQAYTEGFYDRGYINASLYSFQDLRADIVQKQPYALPFITYDFYGDPGATLGGRWEVSGSLLDLQQSDEPACTSASCIVPVPTRIPGQSVERLANNIDWSRKLISDTGLVATLDASAETDYYWTQNPAADPITNQVTAKKTAGRFFPQAYAVLSYPLVRPVGYAKLVIEPIVSGVVAPTNANNQSIPNEDSQSLQLDSADLFSANRFPGIDRLEDGMRVTYGVRAGLYNLGAGYTSIFLGQSYRATGDTIFPATSGLQTRFSDFVGQVDINPGTLMDVDYKFEYSNDFQKSLLQEVNFRVGPSNYGIYGTYLFAGQVNVGNTATVLASARNEASMAAYYKFDENWTVTASTTTELTHPRAVLRFGMSAGYTDDCSTITINVSHDQTQPVGGTSGTAVFLQFSLKNLGVFSTPSIH